MDGWTHERIIQALQVERDELRREVERLRHELDITKEELRQSQEGRKG